uniref:caspase family protein n=1 Tax=Klebsiella aerogenes TaxID=548 RepID=UPI0019534FC4
QFLNSAGFEVIQATDLDHDEMIQVLQDFSAKISARGPNTVAFVYYAGHGLQIAGDNYLVPVDAKISSETDVPNAAVRLVDVMATLQA